MPLDNDMAQFASMVCQLPDVRLPVMEYHMFGPASRQASLWLPYFRRRQDCKIKPPTSVASKQRLKFVALVTDNSTADVGPALKKPTFQMHLPDRPLTTA